MRTRVGYRPARLCMLALSTASVPCGVARADANDATPAAPGPDSRWPALVGAQFTSIVQNQSSLRAPYSGPFSLKPDGDTQPSETIGFYFGWAPVSWGQLYLDLEKFNGAGVSNATGLAGLTNGDVIREGANNLPKRFYVARRYLRLMWPLGSQTIDVQSSQDEVGGREATTRLELKVGTLGVNDDFDKNRYAGAARTQFLNWSLWQDTAWDFAADTRGYTQGFVVAFVSELWSLRYGAYLMPLFANGQSLEESASRARGSNLELTLAPPATGTVLRLLAFENTARMGVYAEALASAAATHTIADIVADDREGRHKYGFGLNVEQALADGGETGVFGRLGWNDGKTEDFAFTEVDRHLSVGGQVSGVHWRRAADRLGIAWVREGLSPEHRAYLAAGGSGFLLGDGRLNYAHERIAEAYYRLEFAWPFPAVPNWIPHQQPRLQIGPDFQYVSNPGYNADRGPVHVWGVRAHLEY